MQKLLAKVPIQRHPWKTMLLPMLVLAPCLLGAMYLRVEVDSGVLWASDSFSAVALRYTREFGSVGSFARLCTVLFAVDEDGQDVLGGHRTCQPYLSSLFRLQSALQPAFERVCSRPSNTGCLYFSPMQYWHNSLQRCASDYNKHVTAEQIFHRTGLGIPLKTSMVFGGLSYQNDALIGARAMRIQFVINSTSSDDAIHFMDELLRLTSVWNANNNQTFAVVAGNTPLSLPQASLSSLSTQWWLPVLGVLLTATGMFVSLGLMIGWRGVLVGLLGLLIVVYSLAIGVSLTSFALPVNPVTAQVVAILILALSIDVLLVLVGIGGEPQQALTFYGPSALLSLITLVATFCCSLVDDTPAGRSVVMTVSITVAVNFTLQLVCIPSALVLLRRRQRTSSSNADEQSKRRTCCRFSDVYASFVEYILARKWTKALVLLLFISLAAFCAYETTRLSIGIDPTLLAPTGSNQAQYQQSLAQNFGSWEPIPWYWVVDAANMSQPDVQQRIQQTKDQLEALPGVTSITSPLSNLVSWIVFGGHHKREYEANGNQIPPHLFAPWLREFLATDGKLQMHDCVFHRNNGTLKAFRAQGVLAGNEITDFSQAVQQVQQLLAHSNISSFSWSPVFPMLSQFFGLEWKSALALSLGIACISTLAVGFFWPNVRIAAVLFICVLMKLVDFLGLMSVIGIQLNAITLLSAVSGAGISAEYQLLMLNAYSEEGNDIVASARKVGSSLILSVLCSCIGMVVLLVFSDAPVIRLYFAALWLGCFIIGAFHAFVLAPVLLSLFTCHRSRRNKYMAVN